MLSLLEFMNSGEKSRQVLESTENSRLKPVKRSFFLYTFDIYLNITREKYAISSLAHTPPQFFHLYIRGSSTIWRCLGTQSGVGLPSDWITAHFLVNPIICFLSTTKFLSIYQTSSTNLPWEGRCHQNCLSCFPLDSTWPQLKTLPLALLALAMPSSFESFHTT